MTAPHDRTHMTAHAQQPDSGLLEQLLLQVHHCLLPGLEGLVCLLLCFSHVGVQALCLCRVGQHNTKELHVALAEPSQHGGLFTAPRSHLQESSFD